MCDKQNAYEHERKTVQHQKSE